MTAHSAAMAIPMATPAHRARGAALPESAATTISAGIRVLRAKIAANRLTILLLMNARYILKGTSL